MPSLRQSSDAVRRLSIFVLGTVALAAASRRSLASPRSHGFARFFGFVALLGLVLVNARWWFSRPWAARQLASWALLASSAALAAHSFRVLRVAGRPDQKRSAEPTLAFERTTVLVSEGAYGLVRHPLYSSLLLLTGGALLKRVSPPALTLALAAAACFVATALAEEPENLRTFGEEYAAYRRRTRLFVPYVL
jgi:protein-S-isoprenylcysteine O-methyltransferase Ste14